MAHRGFMLEINNPCVYGDGFARRVGNAWEVDNKGNRPRHFVRVGG